MVVQMYKIVLYSPFNSYVYWVTLYIKHSFNLEQFQQKFLHWI